MEKYFSETIGIPIVTTSGYKIGRVFDIVINPETGVVAGFLTSPTKQKVLAPLDVIGWDKALTVHDEDSILEIDEIHQVRESLKKDIRLFRNRVVTKSGACLGKVVDFAMNDKMFVLTKIVVAKTILGIFSYDYRIIAHKDIIEIRKDKIIVKNPLKTVPVKETVNLSVKPATL
jgi:uncharacterized protein YrrD